MHCFFFSLVNDLDQYVTTATSKDRPLENGYLVSSPSCYIPSLDPFAPDVMKIFQRRNYMTLLSNSLWMHSDFCFGAICLINIKYFIENYEKCVPGEDATRIEMNWNTSEAKLVYNDSAFVNTMCCCSEIIRSGQGRNADTEFRYVSLSGSQSFE